MAKKSSKRVVILGGGFGGIYTLKNLNKLLKDRTDVKIVLVNKNSDFVFTPLLHEVATGGLLPANAIAPIRACLASKNVFYEANVTGVDLLQKMVRTDRGDINYDYLVVALGAGTDHLGISGAKEHTFELKNVTDARRIKNHTLEIFEEANLLDTSKERKALLSFAVVGGGATGVEFVAELQDYLFNTLKNKFGNIDFDSEVSINLLVRGDALIKEAPEFIGKHAHKHLEKNNVKVLFNHQVTQVEKGTLKFADKKELKVHTIVWAAGVKPNSPAMLSKVQKTSKGRINVLPTLQIEEFENVFVLGDLANFIDEKTQKPLPMLAQVATKQAEIASKNLFDLLNNGKALHKFSFKSSGYLLSLGKLNAVGTAYGIRLKGFIAWWLWRTVYLVKFPLTTKKIKILIDWTIGLFGSRDITKI